MHERRDALRAWTGAPYLDASHAYVVTIQDEVYGRFSELGAALATAQYHARVKSAMSHKYVGWKITHGRQVWTPEMLHLMGVT